MYAAPVFFTLGVMKGKGKAGVLIGGIVFAIVVSGLYGIIYAAPRIEGIGIRTDVVQYEELPIADDVTALFIRDETLYTAAYSGVPEYMIEGGTKVRAGTQVVYLVPDAEPAGIQTIADEDTPKGGVSDGEGIEADAQEEEQENVFQTMLGAAKSDVVVSEGGVTPWTAIVSYSGDGWEKKVTPENYMKLPKSVLSRAPGEAMDLRRDWVRSGEPVYRMTNNNLWRVAFWIEDADKTILDKYKVGRDVVVVLDTTKVRATVEAAEPRGRDIFVVLRSDMYYKDLDKYRVRELSVVFSEVCGAVIEKKAVKLKSGKTGVYVKQQSGAFKWVPVKVLRESGGRYLIAETSFEDEDGKRVTTIKYYDEIMSNPAADGY